MDYVLTTNALCKNYRHFKALNGFSMHVPKGAIYGFVGKNGAGKTTLIRLICGLQEPTAGDYTLYGINNTDKKIKDSRRRIGAVVETPSIYLNMTAEENLKEQYRILGLPSFADIPELLKLVGLEDTGRKKAKNFSLGMRQRLGIAIALCGDPDFLVLDEPINGLDPQGIIEVRELILKLNRQKQITVLISSHILDELSRLATHYGFIDKGRLVKEISARDLENACRKCIRLEVSDMKVFTRVMDSLRLEYHVLSDTQADIFTKETITRLVLSLAKEGCEVLSLTERDESLESYYVSLIGGTEHE
ncbi:MAG: ATP-binding cassette domain-containing protein [Lachnospiraceae bacterium]|nr:ATP-binding cassette domain-containing protein [Lachnospiraceae bacterium]